jgi:hypothetical protein
VKSKKVIEETGNGVERLTREEAEDLLWAQKAWIVGSSQFVSFLIRALVSAILKWCK